MIKEQKDIFYDIITDGIEYDNFLIFFTKDNIDKIYECYAVMQSETWEDFISIKGQKAFDKIQKQLFEYNDDGTHKLYDIYKDDLKGIDVIKKYKLDEEEYDYYKNYKLTEYEHVFDIELLDYNIDIFYPTPQDILYLSLPDEIKRKYLSQESNYHGQQFYSLDINNLDNIIKELKDLGYNVKKKDLKI